jgi:hypothetical protein
MEGRDMGNKVVTTDSGGRIRLANAIAAAGRVVAASSTAQTIPDTAVGGLHKITLTGNCTLTFPTGAVGKSFHLILKQDATGSRTVVWPSGAGGAKWAGGTAPTLTTTAAAVDWIEFVHDGVAWNGKAIAQALA